MLKMEDAQRGCIKEEYQDGFTPSWPVEYVEDLNVC